LSVDVAALRPAKELGRGGADLVDDLDVQRRKHRSLAGDVVQEPADLVGVEEVGRCREAISEPPHAFQRQPGRLRLLQKLRNAGAREPHRRSQVFAGVECAVSKLAQERESKRSEH
jgi:hypothetical protein